MSDIYDSTRRLLEGRKSLLELDEETTSGAIAYAPQMGFTNRYQEEAEQVLDNDKIYEAEEKEIDSSNFFRAQDLHEGFEINPRTGDMIIQEDYLKMGQWQKIYAIAKEYGYDIRSAQDAKSVYENKIISRDMVRDVLQQVFDISPLTEIEKRDTEDNPIDALTRNKLKGTIAIDVLGRPIVMYHATDKDFDEFSISRGNKSHGSMFGKGVYLSEKPEKGFGNKIKKVYLRKKVDDRPKALKSKGWWLVKDLNEIVYPSKGSINESDGDYEELKKEIIERFEEIIVKAGLNIKEFFKNFKGWQGKKIDKSIIIDAFKWDQDFDSLEKRLPDDRGSLELISEALLGKTTLNAFEEFAGYDYIYGTQITLQVNNINIIYTGMIDMGYVATEEISISDVGILKEIDSKIDSVKLSGKVVQPVQQIFEKNVLKQISEIVTKAKSK